MDINIHPKYLKFLIYILHNRRGQFFPFQSLIFLLNSIDFSSLGSICLICDGS